LFSDLSGRGFYWVRDLLEGRFLSEPGMKRGHFLSEISPGNLNATFSAPSASGPEAPRGLAGKPSERLLYQSPHLAAAWATQKGMVISRYIIVAVARCCRACSTMVGRPEELSEVEVAVGESGRMSSASARA